MKKTVIVEEIRGNFERRFKVKRLRNLTRPPVGTVHTEEEVNGLIETGVEVIIDTPRKFKR